MHKKRFLIEDRGRQVSSLLSQSLTETEIGNKLNVDRSTVS